MKLDPLLDRVWSADQDGFIHIPEESAVFYVGEFAAEIVDAHNGDIARLLTLTNV
jgi:hypothetical protein